MSVQVAVTRPSLTFFQPVEILNLGVNVWTDDDEWAVRASLFTGASLMALANTY